MMTLVNILAHSYIFRRRAAGNVPQEIQKTNKENPDKVERERIEAALKQSKYALLKPEDNLTDKQKLKLEEVREVVPLLR